LDSTPKQKRSLNPERRRNASIGRPAGRPTPVLGRSAGRPGPTESSCLSVGRPGGRPILATVDWAMPVHVMHTGRLGGRPAFIHRSTGRSTGLCPGLLHCRSRFLWLLVSVLSSSISSISSLPTTYP